MIEVDLVKNKVREIDLTKVDEIRCQKCGEQVKGRMGKDVYTTEYDVHRFTGILLCPSCKRKLNTWAGTKLEEYEKALVMQWLTSDEKKRQEIDEQGILIKHILDTHDCSLCKELGWKKSCEQANKGCDDFFIPKLKNILLR